MYNSSPWDFSVPGVISELVGLLQYFKNVGWGKGLQGCGAVFKGPLYTFTDTFLTYFSGANCMIILMLRQP